MSQGQRVFLEPRKRSNRLCEVNSIDYMERLTILVYV